MERVWKEKDNCAEIHLDLCIIERVQGWLEREDLEVEKIVSYGLCLTAVTYFMARLLQL